MINKTSLILISLLIITLIYVAYLSKQERVIEPPVMDSIATPAPTDPCLVSDCNLGKG